MYNVRSETLIKWIMPYTSALDTNLCAPESPLISVFWPPFPLHGHPLLLNLDGAPQGRAFWVSTSALKETPMSVGELAPDGGDPRPIGNWAGSSHLGAPLGELGCDKFFPCVPSDAKGACLLNDLVYLSGAARMVTHHSALPYVFLVVFSLFFLSSRPWACTSQIKYQHFDPCLRLSFPEDSCEDVILSHYLKWCWRLSCLYPLFIFSMVA